MECVNLSPLLVSYWAWQTYGRIVTTRRWRLFVIGRPAALAALPESYDLLFDRAAAVFEADERVRAMG